MLVPYNWLKEYVDFSLSPEELAEQLTLTGTGVEKIEHLTQGVGEIVFELEITPNRPDCLGMIGVAREAAAIVGGKVKIPEIEIAEAEISVAEMAQVEILDADLCPRYAARIITDVTVAPSPRWLQQRLKAAGVRPINNVVDTTNYVMLETGQPLHAFDYEQLSGMKIIIRRAREDEKLITLDGALRQLESEMLVIADWEKPIALAGVMGGINSEVTSKTTTILLESANFTPTNIMRTSRKLGLQSESSNRFEKGIDPEGVVYAANRAAQLMQELGGGKVLKGMIDIYPQPRKSPVLKLRPQRVNQILGTDLSPEDMVRILESLELKIDIRHPTSDIRHLQVTIPTFRPDLGREVDLIEEIARLYGYNRIKSTLPASSGRQGELSAEQMLEAKIRETLVSVGLWEVVCYSFIGPDHLNKLGLSPGSHLRRAVVLKNPLSPEQSLMRTTLIPGLLEALNYNTSRGQENVQLFEIGRVFYPKENQPLPDEPIMVAGALIGSWRDKQWYEKVPIIDFFDLKGIIEVLLDSLGIEHWSLRKSAHSSFHPHRFAQLFLGEESAGFMGELHPTVQAAYELPGKTYVFEIKEAKLIASADLSHRYQEIPRYPGVTLDISLVVDEEILAHEVERAIRSKGGKLLRRLSLFDVYRGGQIPTSKKSLAYSLFYQATDRTLTDQEVQEIHQKIIAALKEKFQAEIRA